LVVTWLVYWHHLTDWMHWKTVLDAEPETSPLSEDEFSEDEYGRKRKRAKKRQKEEHYKPLPSWTRQPPVVRHARSDSE
jgi:hypothetical protein